MQATFDLAEIGKEFAGGHDVINHSVGQVTISVPRAPRLHL